MGLYALISVDKSKSYYFLRVLVPLVIDSNGNTLYMQVPYLSASFGVIYVLVKPSVSTFVYFLFSKHKGILYSTRDY